MIWYHGERNLRMEHHRLEEQLNYYRARAAEYDTSLQSAAHPVEENQGWSQAVQSLRALGPQSLVLELAGGTGIWTEELIRIASDLTVLDGSPEMLGRNRLKFNDERIRYEIADLFAWEPAQQYDLVFFAFWLSHVPPDLLDPFLDKLQRAVAPGGNVFIVDEPAGGRQISGPTQDGVYQRRILQDGRVFNIIKVYYDPVDIQRRLQQRGFEPTGLQIGESFFHLIGTQGHGN